MVRLHFSDSYARGTNHTLIDYSKGNSRTLNLDNMDKLDFLVNELKNRGIYIHLDLFVARAFLQGDELDYPDSLIHNSPLKQLNIFNRRLIELQKEYAKQYLLHLNPYTGNRYVDEPAVAVVQVMNENSIYCSVNYNLFPSYGRELDMRWNKWLLDRYESRGRLDLAWTKEDGTRGLLQNESPEDGTVARPSHGGGGQPTVEYTDTYNSVEGPGRYVDYMKFTMEIQECFAREMRGCLINLA